MDEGRRESKPTQIAIWSSRIRILVIDLRFHIAMKLNLFEMDVSLQLVQVNIWLSDGCVYVAVAAPFTPRDILTRSRDRNCISFYGPYTKKIPSEFSSLTGRNNV